MHVYNLARGLHGQSRFDDLDLVSKSQMCQKHKLSIVFFSGIKLRIFGDPTTTGHRLHRVSGSICLVDISIATGNYSDTLS